MGSLGGGVRAALSKSDHRFVSEDRMQIETRSPDETEELGRRIAGILPCGSTVALRGELAAGKTCLVRGMASHFGDVSRVHSPTFTLVNQYGDHPSLYHVDLYRLAPEDVADLGCEEWFDSDGVCAVEWAERAERLLPARRLDVFLEHGGHDTRKIALCNRGLLTEGWQRTLLGETLGHGFE